MRNHFPEELIIPQDIEKDLLSSDSLQRARGEKRRDSLLSKYRKTGIQTAVCQTHGRMSILYFPINERNGKWYVESKCNKCKTKNRVRKKVVKDKEKHRQFVQNQIDKLADGYVRRLLVKSGIERSLVTQAMIIKKRAELEAKRNNPQIGTNWEKKKEKDRSYRRDLTDAYIKDRIRSSRKYRGEEITQDMIDIKRSTILLMRKHGEDKRYIKTIKNFKTSQL